MASESSDNPETPAGRTSHRSRRKSRSDGSSAQKDQGKNRVQEDPTLDLSFREAQTALELSLAELQSADLDIERMSSLYNRARAYADRCETLLQQVEQEVLQWDPDHPETPPQPYVG